MTWDILLGCVVIILARIGDVSLGTMRTVAVVSGHRGLAWLFGLLEMTIWVFAVSAVIAHIRAEPVYGLAFALGAATGNYVGVTVQRWLPFGEQVVRIFTREGAPMFERLRAERLRRHEVPRRGPRRRGHDALRPGGPRPDAAHRPYCPRDRPAVLLHDRRHPPGQRRGPRGVGTTPRSGSVVRRVAVAEREPMRCPPPRGPSNSAGVAALGGPGGGRIGPTLLPHAHAPSTRVRCCAGGAAPARVRVCPGHAAGECRGREWTRAACRALRRQCR
jgi:hypothetical protein